jgi:hypothetical protein
MAVAKVCLPEDLHVTSFTTSLKTFLIVLVQRWCLSDLRVGVTAEVDTLADVRAITGKN